MTLNILQAGRMGVGGYVRYARPKIPSCVRGFVFLEKKNAVLLDSDFLSLIKKACLCLARLVFSLEQHFVVPQNFSLPEFQVQCHKILCESV